MPYTHKKIGNKECVFKKEDGSKVGCTKGSIKKYLAALHANTNESIETVFLPEMKGGKSDGMSIKDIADKHDVPVSKIEKQVSMGKKVEQEHTDNPQTAKEIAMDHEVEIPDYYTRLSKMEKAAFKSNKKDKIDETTKDLIKRHIRNHLMF